MKGQWYRSSLTKGLLIVMEHILLVVVALSLLWIGSYPVLGQELAAGKASRRYEDTVAFTQQMTSMTYDITYGVYQKAEYEIDGKYAPEKIVDIEEYIHTGHIINENKSGLAYTLEDLRKWNESGYATRDSEEYGNYNVIVCQKADGTYEYFYYQEFKAKIESGELRFVMANDNYGMSSQDMLTGLRNQAYNEYSSAAGAEMDFKGLQDAEGRVVYVDCWNYDGDWIEEKSLTIDGLTILELVNSTKEWNGRLSEAFTMVRDTVGAIGQGIDEYEGVSNYYREGDTNLAYLYIDPDKQRVYSNRAAFSNYKDAEKSLEAIRKLGKYAIIYPKLEDFESNMDTDAGEWRAQISSYIHNPEENFIFAIGVDTEFPIQDMFYREHQIYEKYGVTARPVMAAGIVSAVLFLAGLIWLTVITGRRPEKEEVYLSRFDHLKTELSALLIMGMWAIPSMFLVMAVGMSMTQTAQDFFGETHMDLYYNTGGRITYAAMVLGVLLAVYTCAMFLTGYLSLVRRLKAGILWENSILRWLIGFAAEVFRNMHSVWKVILVFGGFVLLHWFFLGNLYWMGWTVLVIVVIEVASLVYLLRQAMGKQQIKNGIERIAGGEVDYQIPVKGLSGEQLIIAEKINSIGEGLDAALEESIKSERLKTDLITNVSHDIKTPLTSIINYIDLLKQENFEDPKVQRYLEVLEAKAQRLKTLTEDVVEASKVSSGNITLEYMNINLVEMIQQTSGEFEEKFKARRLKEVLSLPEQEIVIRADGRRMWRVLENIYNNAAKYAMEGTRIYADMWVEGAGGQMYGTAGRKTVIFSLKNVSEHPLNISADELTERFIRGDISRSTEGSGLGLSIAKTLTEMQGGTFELYLDGDFFRVTITFPIENVDKVTQ